MRLSIILPCYNVEKFIAECLVSLYNQNIPIDEFEVICVNDCSTDRTREIIFEFKEKYNNLILIDHLQNKKQGGARNTGVSAAMGNLIWFVDPDDFVEPNSFYEIINIFENNNIDLVYFNYSTILLNGEIEDNKLFFKRDIHLGVDVFDYEFSWMVTQLAWRRVVKREFLIQNKIIFVENFNFEDVIHGLQCFLYANKVFYQHQKYYNYRKNIESTMFRKLDGEIIASLLNVAVSCNEFSNYKFISEKNRIFLNSIQKFYLNSLFKPILYLSLTQQIIFYKKINEINNKYSILKNCDFKTKIALKNSVIMYFLGFFLKKLKFIKYAIKR
jgi:glycosyltransferase involved in cell wall biosynthesis